MKEIKITAVRTLEEGCIIMHPEVLTLEVSRLQDLMFCRRLNVRDFIEVPNKFLSWPEGEKLYIKRHDDTDWQWSRDELEENLYGDKPSWKERTIDRFLWKLTIIKTEIKYALGVYGK